MQPIGKIDPNDPDVQHEIRHETVPGPQLSLWAAGLPSLVILLYTRTLQQRVLWLSVLVVALSLTLVMCEVLKAAVGRPRPAALAMCDPDPESPSPWDVSACRTLPHVAWDAFRSFPSAHTALASSGIVVAMLCATREQPDALPVWPLLVLPVIPILIAISRVVDNYHHATDVATGMVVGIAAALIADGVV